MSRVAGKHDSPISGASDENTGRRRLVGWSLALGLGWSIAVGVSLWWNVSQVDESIRIQARSQAVASLEKDMTYRSLVSGVGGIYVPINRGIDPNPLLAHVARRDVETSDGQRLTLINSSYFTRLVHDREARHQDGLRGHVTSRNPLRAANRPDYWEQQALTRLEAGAAEVGEVVRDGEHTHYRLMRPRITESSCLACHRDPNLKVGQILGGISVSVPMEPLEASAYERIHTLVAGHGLLWVLGVLGINLGYGMLGRREQALRESAYFDTLTGLPNRRLFHDRLERAIVEARQHQHLGAVLYVDLDDFKTVNESLGHDVGDGLLRLVARVQSEALRAEDTVARIGGDEFVVLLPWSGNDSGSGMATAQSVAEALREALDRPFEVQGHELHTSPSIGIALFPLENDGADDVLRQADAAMYKAKESGRGGFQFFLPAMQEAAQQRLSLENDLRHALERHELELYFQPQLTVAGDRIVGAEALLRWHRGTEMVSPARFIPVAEDSGLILPLGDWVLSEACRYLKQWQGLGAEDGWQRIAVNVSARQFRQAGFVDGVARIIDLYEIDPSRLELELTESTLIDDVSDTAQKMLALRKLGVRLAIDDFGTGYSSLAYLKSLPLDMLKIDYSFIRDIPGDSNDAAIVESIMAMAWRFEFEVVAEGVERDEQLAFLRSRGCDTYQGFLFSRPVPAAAFEAMLEEQVQESRRQLG